MSFPRFPNFQKINRENTTESTYLEANNNWDNIYCATPTSTETSTTHIPSLSQSTRTMNFANKLIGTCIVLVGM